MLRQTDRDAGLGGDGELASGDVYCVDSIEEKRRKASPVRHRVPQDRWDWEHGDVDRDADALLNAMLLDDRLPQPTIPTG